MRKRKDTKKQLSPRVFVSWICQRDYPLIALHHAALRKLTDESIIYVFDKTEKDATPPQAPKDCIIIGSDFERAGNLNGKICIENMISFYMRLIDLGVEIIVKNDIDTIFTSLDWLDIGGNVGYHSANGLYFTGCAYKLTGETIKGIYSYLSRHDICPRAGYELPEDATITMLASLAGADSVNILENGEYTCVGFNHPMRNKPEILRKVRGIVHCGQWQRVDALCACGLQRVDIVASDMRFCLGALYPASSPRPLYSYIPEHSFVSKKLP